MAAAALAACSKQPKLTVQFPDKYEGKEVELLNYLDSTTTAKAQIANGTAEFITEKGSDPELYQIVVEGKVQGYYISEGGNAVITDSTTIAKGTPLNDLFAAKIAQLDSIENLDDMDLYMDYAEKEYNAARGSAIGDFFGVEWMKFAAPQRVDSLLKLAQPDFRDRKRVKHYEAFARHRAATAPGMKYIDFEGENASGGKTKLSSLVKEGRFTLVDFWASWCPYCIKELPDLKKLQEDFGDGVLQVVGVAVRDLPADTKEMAAKHELKWPILYNTQKTPYDIYGFSGIPHHMLLAPDGTIISRGENVAQIRTRLEKLLSH